MKTTKPRLIIDFETRSEADLKKVGAIKYAKHPSTEVLCAAYKINDGKTESWAPVFGDDTPGVIYNIKNQYTIVAHNALFEWCIFNYVLGFDIPIEHFDCTAARAAAMALPRSLEGAGAALGLKVQKDMHGNRLMKKYMKPRPHWTKHGIGDKYFSDEFELLEVLEYCKTDIEVEYILDNKLAPLNETERRVWVINQHSNINGVTVDVTTSKKILGLINENSLDNKTQLNKLTGGKVKSPAQREVFLKWLQDNGYKHEDLKADTVATALDDTLTPLLKKALEIRQSSSMTSNKKYTAIVERADDDNRVKDISMYHGASTGREAARGLQLQNLPRGKIKDTLEAVRIIQCADDLEYLKCFYDSPSELFSSCIRPMVTSSPGKLLAVADYNAIECRVLNWLADNSEAVEAFRSNKDFYIIMASRILNKNIKDITDAERFLGKTVVLGCGYQMGADRFYKTCIQWGVPNVTQSLAYRAVKIYRDTHQPVVNLWALYETAAINAVKYKTKQFTVGRVTWYCKSNFLFCKLPSGRRLSFPKPELRNEPTPWGEVRPKLYYYRVDALTKKWVCKATYGGSLVESVCQATARDVTMNGIMNAISAGYNYLFQVHDEIISEHFERDININNYCKLLTEPAPWFKDLPIKASGWSGERYKK